MCLQMSGFKSADFHDFSYKCDAIGGYLKERQCAFITETNYLGNNRSLLYESAGTHTHTNWKYAEYFSAQPGGPYTITVNYKSNDVKVRLGLSLCTPWRKRSGVIAPHFTILGTKRGCVVNFMSRPLYSYFREKSRCMLWSPAGNGTRFLGFPARNLVTIPPTLTTSSALINYYTGVCKTRVRLLLQLMFIRLFQYFVI